MDHSYNTPRKMKCCLPLNSELSIQFGVIDNEKETTYRNHNAGANQRSKKTSFFSILQLIMEWEGRGENPPTPPTKTKWNDEKRCFTARFR
jgi:hypothetical protein